MTLADPLPAVAPQAEELASLPGFLLGNTLVQSRAPPGAHRPDLENSIELAVSIAREHILIRKLGLGIGIRGLVGTGARARSDACMARALGIEGVMCRVGNVGYQRARRSR